METEQVQFEQPEPVLDAPIAPPTQANVPPAPARLTPPPPVSEIPVLQRLASPPFPRGKFPLLGILASVYEHVQTTVRGQ